MNQLLLTPTDTLFFRDGRPMEGSLSGHGAAWPLPTVTNSALHAALHDARRNSALTGSPHLHDHMRGTERALKDIRAFGSLTTAGPFPVNASGVWFFPRPLDLTSSSLRPTLLPIRQTGSSSLPAPLLHILASSQAPSKNQKVANWLSSQDITAYLKGSSASPSLPLEDKEIYNAENMIGIAIDPSTGTTGQGEAAHKIYSAQYLRMQEGWQLGLLATTEEKQADGSRRDLISQDLYRSSRGHLILGGQQRVCSVLRKTETQLPLPQGLTQEADFNKSTDGRVLLKWVLLTPAIFPLVNAGVSRRSGATRKSHPGGWLPSWVDASTGEVLLQVVDEAERIRRRKLNYNGQGYDSRPDIRARLVASRIDKPLPVTGWSNGDESLGDENRNGAKSTHLAVPAGSVYYFSCDSAEDARALANALNWHGDSSGTRILRRRSTLLGEKGFGLGVCGTWQFHGATHA